MDDHYERSIRRTPFWLVRLEFRATYRCNHRARIKTWFPLNGLRTVGCYQTPGGPFAAAASVQTKLAKETLIFACRAQNKINPARALSLGEQNKNFC